MVDNLTRRAGQHQLLARLLLQIDKMLLVGIAQRGEDHHIGTNDALQALHLTHLRDTGLEDGQLLVALQHQDREGHAKLRVVALRRAVETHRGGQLLGNPLLDDGLAVRAGDADNLAIEDFNFILSIDPSDMMATFNRATLLENTGDYQGAIQDYTTVIEEYPKFLYGYERRAAARRKIGDIAGATKDEEHVLKEQIAQRYGYTTSTSRQKNKTRKKSEFNIEDYNKLVEEDSSEQEQTYESEYRGKVQNREQSAKLILPTQNTYNIYREAGRDSIITCFEKAFQDAQAGNINDAIDGFSQVLEFNDSFVEAYYNRGLLKLLIDDPIGAIPDLSKAGELGIYQAYNIIKRNQNLKTSTKKQ